MHHHSNKICFQGVNVNIPSHVCQQDAKNAFASEEASLISATKIQTVMQVTTAEPKMPGHLPPNVLKKEINLNNAIMISNVKIICSVGTQTKKRSNQVVRLVLRSILKMMVLLLAGMRRMSMLQHLKIIQTTESTVNQAQLILSQIMKPDALLSGKMNLMEKI